MNNRKVFLILGILLISLSIIGLVYYQFRTYQEHPFVKLRSEVEMEVAERWKALEEKAEQDKNERGEPKRFRG